MNQNKEKYKKKSIFSDTLSLKYCIKWRSWETCFLLLAVLQFVLIAGFNLFDTPRAVDSDSAKLFLHAMEIAENKTLLLPGWIYTTTLEIDPHLSAHREYLSFLRNRQYSHSFLFLMYHIALIPGMRPPFKGCSSFL